MQQEGHFYFILYRPACINVVKYIMLYKSKISSGSFLIVILPRFPHVLSLKIILQLNILSGVNVVMHLSVQREHYRQHPIKQALKPQPAEA